MTRRSRQRGPSPRGWRTTENDGSAPLGPSLRGLQTTKNDGLLPLTAIFIFIYIHNVECSVLFTEEFGSWWNSLSIEEQESVTYSVDLLARLGIELKFPHSSGVSGSRYAHMRELRVQHQGRPYRVLYAFDPQRNAVLLIGGDKTGNEQWYETSVPLADRLYERHLIELEESDNHAKSKKL